MMQEQFNTLNKELMAANEERIVKEQEIHFWRNKYLVLFVWNRQQKDRSAADNSTKRQKSKNSLKRSRGGTSLTPSSNTKFSTMKSKRRTESSSNLSKNWKLDYLSLSKLTIWKKRPTMACRNIQDLSFSLKGKR